MKNMKFRREADHFHTYKLTHKIMTLFRVFIFAAVEFQVGLEEGMTKLDELCW
jgi:hypothetical protein